MVDKHRSLIKDRNDLAASSQDASRLMARGQKGEKRDPTRLLREEKMRKRIAKDLPKVAAELRRALESWEEEYGRPFLVHGDRYVEELEAAAPKAPPPRSKTPSALNSSTMAKSVKSAPPSQRGGTVRGAPPPRSKTPTATIGRNVHLQSKVPDSVVSTASTMRALSPSKIPSRAPLRNMPYGDNSPERRPRPHPVATEELHESTMRKMGPPPSRAPPPKMKDLFIPPTPTSVPEDPLSVFRSGSIVRQVQPEDVYDDRAPSSLSSNRPGSVLRHNISQHPSYSSCASSILSGHSYGGSSFIPEMNPAGSRQISAASSAAGTQISGSENWETYDDASEPEDDYYARLKAAQGKRMKPAGGYATGDAVMGKKIRAVNEDMYVGREESWETEDAF